MKNKYIFRNVEKEKAMRRSNKTIIKNLQLKGALKLEKKTIRILLFISMFALSLSVVIQYVFPMYVAKEILELIHYEFIINVLLGVAGSASISLICIWIPFLTKKEVHQNRLILAVKDLFYNYKEMRVAILSNSNRDISDTTFLGELTLIKHAQTLEKSARKLLSEYGDYDITCESLEKVVDSVNTVFIPIVEMISDFIKIILPQDHNGFQDLFGRKKEDFDINENKELYIELISSMDEIMPYEEIVKLFSDYVDHKFAAIEIFQKGTNDFLENIQLYNDQTRISLIKMELNYKMMMIFNKFSDERFRKKGDVLNRIQALRNVISALPQESRNEYNSKIAKIYDCLNENQMEMVENELKTIEEELNVAKRQ